jgi:hypothetical protein
MDVSIDAASSREEPSFVVVIEVSFADYRSGSNDPDSSDRQARLILSIGKES